MPTPKKTLEDKQYKVPSRTADREPMQGITPSDYPPPAYLSDEHKARWQKELEPVAPQLRPVDIGSFRLYFFALLKHEALQEQAYQFMLNPPASPEDIEHSGQIDKELTIQTKLLMQLQDKLAVTPFTRGRVPSTPQKGETLTDAIGAMFGGI
jgi:hypothetical protein